MKNRPLDFSFSGIKTSVLYALREKTLSDQERADAAAAFQEAAFGDIAAKTFLAAQQFPCRALYLGGGVSSNQRLRALFAQRFPELPQFWPPKELSLDNAAMIAGLGFHKFIRQGRGDPLDLEALARIPIA